MSELFTKALDAYREVSNINQECSVIVFNDVLVEKCRDVTSFSPYLQVSLEKKDDGKVYLAHRFKLCSSSMNDSMEILSEKDILSSGILNFINDYNKQWLVSSL